MSISRESYIQKKQELEAELKANGKTWIAEVLHVALTALQPQGITGIRWSQYTPYFNDGDPCVFSCGLDYYDLLKDGEWCDQYEFTDDERAKFPNLRARDAGGDEVFHAAFGDHVHVEARLVDGGVQFAVDEYDHD